MKTILFLLIIALVLNKAHAQFVHKIKADSVLVTNDSCTAELNLENSTKHIKGFLYNKGNGRTEFRKVVKLNDNAFIMGEDTLVFGGTPKNLATTSLTATSNYTHNWNHKQLWFDSISVFRLNSFETDATFSPRKLSHRLWFGNSISSAPFNLTSILRNAANTSDSLWFSIRAQGLSLLIDALDNTSAGVKLARIQATATSFATGTPTVEITAQTSISNQKFISVNADSITIKGALPKSTADSVLAIGPDNSRQANALYKIPMPGFNGPKVLLRDSAANVAQLDIILNAFTLGGEYDRIEIQIEKCRPATDNTDLLLRFSSDNGASFNSGASDYEWVSNWNISNGTSGTHGINGQTSDSKIGIVQNVGNNTAYSCNGSITLYHPFDSSLEPLYDGHLISNSNSSGNLIKNDVGGRRKTAQVTSAVRLYFSSGNIEKIKYRVIGYRN